MAECFWPGVTTQKVEAAGERIRQAARASSSNGQARPLPRLDPRTDRRDRVLPLRGGVVKHGLRAQRAGRAPIRTDHRNRALRVAVTNRRPTDSQHPPAAADGKPKGHTMKRTIPSRMRATAALALACTAALVFAVAAVQARSAHSAASQATAVGVSDCKLVISGAPWRIRAGVPGGSIAGNKYTIKDETFRAPPCVPG